MREDHWQIDELATYNAAPFISIERLVLYIERYEAFLKWPILQSIVGNIRDSKVWKYEEQILSSISPFIENCKVSPHAPQIRALIKEIIDQDMAFILLVNYGYFFLEHHANKLNNTMYAFVLNFALTVLSAGLLLFTLPYSLQFFVHKTALLLKLPEMFRLMSDKRQDISNAICTNCNVLRYNKGLYRDLVTFGFQQIFLFLIRSAPSMVSPAASRAVSLLSSISYPFEWLFTGQLLFGYPLFAAGLCQREVLTNLREYPELYLALGATYHATFFALTYLIAAALKTTAFVGYYFPVLGSFVEVLGVLPTSVYETFLAGFLTICFVGLAHHVPFPKAVMESSRYRPDWITCVSADLFTDASIYLVKERFLKRIAEVKNQAMGFYKIASDFQNDFLILAHAIGAFIKDENSVEETKLFFLEMQDYCRTLPFPLFFEEKNTTIIDIWEYIIPSCQYMMKLSPHLVVLWKNSLPSLLKENKGVFQDKILELVLPKILIDAHNFCYAMLEFRNRAKNILSWIKKIDAFFSNRKVKILCWLVGVKGVTDLLTLDFIVNQGPNYLDEIRGLLASLLDWKIINNQIYQQMSNEIEAFKKHLVLIQKIMGNLPKSFIEDFIIFLREDRSENYLRKGEKIIFEMLKKADPKLRSMGSEIFEEFDLLQDKKGSSNFPVTPLEFQSADFHRHFRPGSTISFSQGHSIVSYVEEEDFAVVTQSREMPSGHFFQQSGGARPVIVHASSSDSFDSADIPSDEEAFEEKFSGAGFRGKNQTTTLSRNSFLTTMAATSKERLARVAESFVPTLSFGK